MGAPCSGYDHGGVGDPSKVVTTPGRVPLHRYRCAHAWLHGDFTHSASTRLHRQRLLLGHAGCRPRFTKRFQAHHNMVPQTGG